MIREVINKGTHWIESKRHPSKSRFSPIYTQIEITRKCNLNCVMCLRHQRPEIRINQDMGFELFKKIIGGFPFLKSINITGLGEPTLHKDFNKIIDYLYEREVKIIIFTNLLAATREQILKMLGKVHLFQVSVCGTAETYERIQENGKWSKLVSQVKLLFQLKKEFGFSNEPLLNYTITSNKEAMLETFKFFYGLGFKRFKFNIPYTMWLNKKDLGDLDYQSIGKGFDEIRDYAKENNLELEELAFNELKIKQAALCNKFWGDVFVDYRGKVFPCLMDVDDKFIAGSLVKNSFKEIWNNKKFRDYRTKKRLPPCDRCGRALVTDNK